MEKGLNVTPETMEKVIEAIGQAFRREAEEEHAELCAKYIDKYGKRLLDPEVFHALVSFDSEEMQELLILNLLNGEQIVKGIQYTDEQLYHLEFLYKYYHYMENHLDKLFERYEGVPFSTDKTRYVLRLYKNEIITGEQQLFSEEKEFWVPKAGSAEAWLAFTKSLPGLYVGDADDYLKSREVLIKELEETLQEKKETQHRFLTLSPYYEKKSEREKKREVVTVYSFKHGEEILDIIQKENGEVRYTLTVDGKRYSRKEQKEGLFPDWVNAILNDLP